MKIVYLVFSGIILNSALVFGALAQTTEKSVMLQQTSPVIVATPAARSVDVQTIDGIVAALYDVISGGVGQARDWSRMRSLFIPDARIMAIGPKRDSKDFALRIMSVSDYIANSMPAESQVQFTWGAIPAPGAMAAFALMGLNGRRRRGN